MSRWIIAISVVIATLVALVAFFRKEFRVMKNQPVEILRTSLRVINEFPDPAEINTAGKWYFLNHVSSPLIEYDHKNSSFKPLIAKKWDIRGSHYTFTLDENAKFSDGTKISARDVAASIKRILAKKTSTHFPLWEHVAGCETLKNLEAPCAALTSDDAKGIVEIDLTGKSESFLLQISSPESGIWSASDIDPQTLALTPSRYSGPYALEKLKANENGEMVLLRNSFAKIQENFPNSPKKILVKSLGRVDVEKSVALGATDIFMGDFIPYNEYDWEKMNVGVHHTTPSSIIYFFGLNSKKKIGLDLLKGFTTVPEKRLIPADTLLPFAPSVALTRDEVAKLLPAKSDRTLTVAAPGFYFREKFLSYLTDAAKDVGIDLKFVKIEMLELMELLNSSESYKSKYDFLLGSYVASERYPAVQLRFVKGKRVSPINLDGIEAPDNDPVKIERLKDFEKWLLSSQTVIPIYFMRSHIVYRKSFDIGDQPVTDADLQLWRITKRAE